MVVFSSNTDLELCVRCRTLERTNDNLMKAITISNFRSHLKSHLDDISRTSEIIVIPRNNKQEDAVVVMSIAEYNSIKETEYLLSSKANRERLQKSLREAATGKTRRVELESMGS